MFLIDRFFLAYMYFHSAEEFLYFEAHPNIMKYYTYHPTLLRSHQRSALKDILSKLLYFDWCGPYSQYRVQSNTDEINSIKITILGLLFITIVLFFILNLITLPSQLGVEQTEKICVKSGIGYISWDQDRVGFTRCWMDRVLNIFSFA